MCPRPNKKFYKSCNIGKHNYKLVSLSVQREKSGVRKKLTFAENVQLFWSSESYYVIGEWVHFLPLVLGMPKRLQKWFQIKCLIFSLNCSSNTTRVILHPKFIVLPKNSRQVPNKNFFMQVSHHFILRPDQVLMIMIILITKGRCTYYTVTITALHTKLNVHCNTNLMFIFIYSAKKRWKSRKITGDLPIHPLSSILIIINSHYDYHHTLPTTLITFTLFIISTTLHISTCILTSHVYFAHCTLAKAIEKIEEACPSPFRFTFIFGI